ncbi:MAG: DNA-directed RNA polymerase subunit alpha [Patescibacteria group bacterium]|nr:DNA-directed RNA polymerase subunit alpha [Patescibacteria group bacterium]
MQNIALPQKIDFKDGEKPNQGLVIIEPCYPGYGMTLGNCLRRVLLSSLPGAAITGVKIKGADHEFMALPHIKEDVLQIILNLKKLRVKVFSEEEVKLELDVHGKKEVKAGDIAKNAQVEIKNPDLVLAHITDMAGSLNMEIYVSQGRGYRPVENIENENKEIGYMEMDSVFSPVFSASVKVENTRVGKMTNWDKLILDIITDGTITPREAFEQAVAILIEQFNSLTEKEKEAVIKEEKLIPEEEKRGEDKDVTSEEPKKKRGRPKKI